MDPTIIKKTSVSASGENNAPREILKNAMALTLYFTSTFHSVMDTSLPKTPSKLPDGLFTALITIPITWICISSQLIITCGHIMKHKPKTKHKRRHKRLA